MTRGNVELVRAAWERFSQGDLRVVERTLDPQVRWYGAGDPDGEGGCQNREEALAFIRSALANGTTVRLLDIHDAGDRLVLTLQRNRRPDEDSDPDPHGEVVTVHDGKITEMVVFPTVEEAFAAIARQD